MVINGGSTGLEAVHVIVTKVAINVQNRICDSGRNIIDRVCEVWVKGAVVKIRTDKSNASVPPSLFGIDRRMPYANRKYHSGLICCGVTSGLALEKFSGSLSKLGENDRMISNRVIIEVIISISL